MSRWGFHPALDFFFQTAHLEKQPKPILHRNHANCDTNIIFIMVVPKSLLNNSS